jgi:rhodanese-related sulfurtransferase
MAWQVETGVAVVTPQELYARYQRGEQVELIDVRTPAEFSEVHAVLARSVPLDGLEPRAVMENRRGEVGSPLYVICRSGARSRKACERFRAAGFDNVVDVEGGTLAWEAAGLPVERAPRRVLPIDRQVRIATGTITAVGTLLGAFVHPLFLVLPFLCGVRAIHSGLTNCCLMSRILSWMPWNRASAGTPTDPNTGCCASGSG